MMSNTIRIKVLTPIWTGNAKGYCDRLREAGIIGSIRWWYEAVVRGLDEYACDPTNDDLCELSSKANSEKERNKKMCPVCYVFGCGGWKRRFRLKIEDNYEKVPLKLATLDKKEGSNHRWLTKIFKFGDHGIENKLAFGNVDLNFTLGRGENEIEKQLKAILSIMAHLGAIGAKTQFGFGQFDWESKMDLKNAINTIRCFLKKNKFKQNSNTNESYSLENFWLYEIKLTSENDLVKKFKNATLIGNDPLPEEYIPISFDIRYRLPSSKKGLRESFYLEIKNRENKDEAKKKKENIFGIMDKKNKKNKIGSRIFVSHLFKKEKNSRDYWLKVWGFTENDVGTIIGQKLKEMFNLSEIPQMKQGSEITSMGDV